MGLDLGLIVANPIKADPFWDVMIDGCGKLVGVSRDDIS